MNIPSRNGGNNPIQPTTTTTTTMLQRMRSERRLVPMLPVVRSISDVSLPTAGDISSCGDDSSTESYWLSSPNNNNTTSSQQRRRQQEESSDKYSLPMWSSSTTNHPQSPGSSDTGAVNPVRMMANTTYTSMMIANHTGRIPIVLMGVLIMMGLFAIVAPRITLHQAAEQIAAFHSHRDELQSRLSRYEQNIQDIERRLNTIDFDFNQQHLGFIAASSESTTSKDGDELHEQNLSEMNELQLRLQNELTQAQFLKQQVQIVSRNATIEKYGPASHFVEVKLVFPNDDNNNNKNNHKHDDNNNNDHNDNDGPTTFIIEMASIDLMPHSVHTFLEMSSLGLLDGCSFILNALQVVKAAPLPYDGTSAAIKAKEFAQHGLESVSFKEYSPEYPHTKYTVGFAADGSPSFYINMADNSDIHVGDPCFGKVISGFDTIQRLANRPTRNGIWFQQRIGIQSARILPRI